jgi:hypothetical protein
LALVLAVVFGLAMTGCAGVQQAGGGSGPRAAGGGGAPAVGNADAVVRALGGKATVDGATVTLTADAAPRGRVDVPGGVTLIVPEDVTLDLTAAGVALELRHGAVLTVDGTVKARGHGDRGNNRVDGSLRIGDGEVVINGSGTIRLASKGELLNVGSGRKLTLDGAILTGLEDNDRSLVDVNNGGEFILKSGAITGNTRVSDDWANGGGVNVHKAAFTMEGGQISGNAASGKGGSGGGGVFVGGGSVFTMNGGAITLNRATGNTGDAHGGGVGVQRGRFVMRGGSIAGNAAQGDTGDNNYGGGVSVEGGEFLMSGGAIKENAVTGGKWAIGGGAYVSGLLDEGEDVSFVMSGGAVSGNVAKGKTGGSGGGLSLRLGDFTMSGGMISLNSAQGGEGQAGGVKVDGGVFTMRGGTIGGNSAEGSVERYGAGVCLDAVRGRKSTFTLSGGTIYGSAAAAKAGANANETRDGSGKPAAGPGAALYAGDSAAKWGEGGVYTKGGVPQAGGSDIGNTDATLIATPAK